MVCVCVLGVGVDVCACVGCTPVLVVALALTGNFYNNFFLNIHWIEYNFGRFCDVVKPYHCIKKSNICFTEINKNRKSDLHIRKVLNNDQIK